MNLTALNKSITDVENATVMMYPGDHLSIGVEVDGKFHILNVHVQGRVIMVQHEQSQDALLVRPGGTQYVQG